MMEEESDVKSICLKNCFKYQADQQNIGESLLEDSQRQPPNAGDSYECRFCQKTFASDSRLRRHGDTVHSSERR